MMKTAFLFPGQGAQSVGMASEILNAIPDSRAMFDKASQIVGYDVAKICLEGPEDLLNSTAVSQPAIFVVSAVILEQLRKSTPLGAITPLVTAGLSLGEYTALYAAGAIGFEDTVKLVLKRGQAMQSAAEAASGSMVSVIGLEDEDVRKLCEEAGAGRILKCANFNCPGQIAISGDKDACLRAVELAPGYGALKAVELKVAGAFHTEMMSPAADALGRALADADITIPTATRIIANVDVQYYNSADAVRKGLVRQLVEPIRWQQCMEKLLADGVEQFYEIGPGRVLTGLMKRINRKTKMVNISSLDAIEQFKEQDVIA
jgi:[acyl-carrier-protein] S-malonyltransferase